MITLLASLALSMPAAVTGTVNLTTGKPGRSAVVWLEGDQKSKPLAKAVVDQRNRAFIPHISVVTVGTEIEFPNNDTVFHNVFAAFEAKKFDLGLYPRGKKKVQKFGQPGLVALMCSIHSEMSAFVMVVDTPYYTVADGAGKFSFTSVPSGAYTLRAWHETGEVYSEPVRVAGGEKFAIKTIHR